MIDKEKVSMRKSMALPFIILMLLVVLNACSENPELPSFVPLSTTSPIPSLALPSVTPPSVKETAALVSITGWLMIVWGEETRYSIADEQGNVTRLLIHEEIASPFGGVLALNRKKVTVTGQPATDLPAALQVLSIRIEKDGQTSP